MYLAAALADIYGITAVSTTRSALLIIPARDKTKRKRKHQEQNQRKRNDPIQSSAGHRHTPKSKFDRYILLLFNVRFY